MAKKKKSNTKKKIVNNNSQNKTQIKKTNNIKKETTTPRNKTQINKTNNKKVVNKTNISKNKSNITLPKKKIETKQTKISKPKKIKTTKLTKKIILEEEKKDKKLNMTLLVVLVFIIIIFVIDYSYIHFYISPTPLVDDIKLENNIMVITFHKDKYSLRDDIYCLYKEDKNIPEVNDNRWFLTYDNNCLYQINDKTYYTFLKNEDDEIFKVNNTEKMGFISSIRIDKDLIYMPINDNYKLNIEYDKTGHINEEIKWSSDNENVATVSDGIVKSIAKGEATITASINNKKVSTKVIVTNLITKRPKNGYNYKKKYLSCNKYSENENDQLDLILKTKINEVGYKTRAAVVEAARFLTLDFPYKIDYFYENGRQTTNHVDGEGRYYHVGLYLHNSRYKNIKGKKKGPKTWGCNLFSTPAHRKMKNGLDCSGFVSWALLNGGFDVKDVGAGWSDNRDLTDYGKVKRITTTLSKGNTIKVGDLLHSERAGGHIGIIIGIDKNNYYVAQALWYGKTGVVITKINKANLKNHFHHVVLMDKYYKNDGKLTNMW